MALARYFKSIKKTESYEKFVRQRLIEWRKEPYLRVIDHPTDLISARRLGYKPKQGIIIARIRLSRGQKQKPRINKGRRTKHMRQRLALAKSYQVIAEERAAKRFSNLEVLNSYNVGKDGVNYWFEIILVDKNHPAVLADKNLSWIASGKHRGRAYRGLTSAGKKSRGLRGKGKGFEKARPSRR